MFSSFSHGLQLSTKCFFNSKHLYTICCIAIIYIWAREAPHSFYQPIMVFMLAGLRLSHTFTQLCLMCGNCQYLVLKILNSVSSVHTINYGNYYLYISCRFLYTPFWGKYENQHIFAFLHPSRFLSVKMYAVVWHQDYRSWKLFYYTWNRYVFAHILYFHCVGIMGAL